MPDPTIPAGIDRKSPARRAGLDDGLDRWQRAALLSNGINPALISPRDVEDVCLMLVHTRRALSREQFAALQHHRKAKDTDAGHAGPDAE